MEGYVILCCRILCIVPCYIFHVFPFVAFWCSDVCLVTMCVWWHPNILQKPSPMSAPALFCIQTFRLFVQIDLVYKSTFTSMIRGKRQDLNTVQYMMMVEVLSCTCYKLKESSTQEVNHHHPLRWASECQCESD